MNKLIASLILVSLFSSCKTQEQIKREQMVEIMSVQVTQGQKVTADATVKLQNLEEKIMMLQGQLEETGHTKDQNVSSLNERLKAQEELIKSLTQSLSEQTNSVAKMQDRLTAQDKLLSEILSTVKSATSAPAPSKEVSAYDQAMGLYGKGKYKEAKPALESLLNDSKVKGLQKARVLHNLGMISFSQKNDQDTLTYLSKLFTDYPKSTYNANGLIHMAKVFIKLNQKDQAKVTLEEMLKNFPKHKSAKTAKDMLSKL